MRGLMRAVDAAGGWEPLAARLGVRTATLRRWIRDKAIPLEQAEKLRRWYNAPIQGNRKDHGNLAVLRNAMRAGLRPLVVRRMLGIHDDTLRGWIREGRIPPRRVAEIEKLIERYGKK